MKRWDLGTLGLTTAAGCLFTLTLAGTALTHYNNDRLRQFEGGSRDLRTAQLRASQTPYITFNGERFYISVTTGSLVAVEPR